MTPLYLVLLKLGHHIDIKGRDVFRDVRGVEIALELGAAGEEYDKRLRVVARQLWAEYEESTDYDKFEAGWMQIFATTPTNYANFVMPQGFEQAPAPFCIPRVVGGFIVSWVRWVPK
jgi:hypothetical protein